jgi:hypothetical protein
MTYEEYKITLSSDPSVYGDISPERTEEINDRLSSMIKAEFPGIQIEISNLDCCGKTTGPDQNVLDEINSWISENWTAAL